MTEALFLQDAYLREAPGRVVSSGAEGVVLDRSLFYARSGGQPGDAGVVTWAGGELPIAEAVKGDAGTVLLLPEDPEMALPQAGAEVVQSIDWARRLGHMRVHTALHLLSVVIPLPVTGGAITAVKGRLDFDMPDAPEDKLALEDALNALIARDLPVTDTWITDAELDANPGLVKTMSVQPPRGAGKIRLVAIGEGPDRVDLQPCGGTHVARTAEIRPVRLGKIEKKGRANRRVSLLIS
ncbi:MAG: alanyl-tRNA editing protein [Pseudomonadota bacterium]